MTDTVSDTPRATQRRCATALTAMLLGLLLHGCSSVPQHAGGASMPPPVSAKDGAPLNPPDVSKVPDAEPRVEPRSRYGNPPSYTVMGEEYHVMSSGLGYDARGRASWYGTKFHGQRTSSGEPYDMYAMTAAHRTLPIPSYARVTNLANGRSVVVRVNDRGPFHSERLIDLSYTAAARLGMLGHGTANVEVRAIDPLAALNAGVKGNTATAHAGDTHVRSPARADQPATGKGRMYLQVGAFTRRGNAARLIARLQRAEFPGVRLSPATHQHTTVYRVQVGPLASANEAQHLSERLTRFGIALPQVVTD